MSDSLLLPDAVEEYQPAVYGKSEVFKPGISCQGELEEFKIQDRRRPQVSHL